LKFIKELDSIRGIGIIIVVLFHWLPVDAFYNTFPNRPFGVDVFFVLSGYLITHILLSSRLGAEAAGIPKKHVFINFYLRRALRILPAYFIVILLIVLIHHSLDATLKGELIPSLTFTLNFYFHENQYWGDLTTHLWTLSVEEQFYLIWPCVMLLIPLRLLPYGILIFISVGIGSQLLITDKEFGYLPTNTCFDAFGIGAWMAWVRLCRPSDLSKHYRAIQWLGAISCIILFFGAAFPDVVFLAPQRTFRSLVAVWAISYIIYKDSRGELRDLPVFSNRILIFLGKISYGMYLYHIFLPWSYYQLNMPLNDLLPDLLEPFMFPITVIENFVLLVLISWISYRFIERPIVHFTKREIRPGAMATKKMTEPSITQ
jgi:peptidoglycan/LPS O-acetylase OafA/YrhL